MDFPLPESSLGSEAHNVPSGSIDPFSDLYEIAAPYVLPYQLHESGLRSVHPIQVYAKNQEIDIPHRSKYEHP